MNGGLREERILASPNATDGRFSNLNGVKPEGGGLPGGLSTDFFLGGVRRQPPRLLPVHDPRERWARPPTQDLRITWLGHSSLLLEIEGLRVLTDPMLGLRASPLPFTGPKRLHRAPATALELPAIDVLVLSHDHYDHLCKSTIRALAGRDLAVVTALGVGRHLEAFGMDPRRIHELDWFEHVAIRGVRFTALPAQHFSGRGFGDRNATLWASFAIESERKRLFFSGDTGVFPELVQIGERFGPFDLTLLEVGAYHPSWDRFHLGPEQALRVHGMLGGRKLLPIHWGTFDLGRQAWHEPAETLYRCAETEGVQLVLPELGLALEPGHDEAPRPWWRRIVHGPSE